MKCWKMVEFESYTKEVERTGGRAIEIGELRFIIYSEQAVLIYTIIREKTPVS